MTNENQTQTSTGELDQATLNNTENVVTEATTSSDTSDTQDSTKTTANIITLPNDEDPESYNSFYKALGRPDTLEEYQLPEVPEGLPVDEATEAWKKETAFALGLNQKQANELANRMNEMFAKTLSDLQTDYQERSNQELSQIQKEWGDDYKKNVELARRALTASGLVEKDIQNIEQSIGVSKMYKSFLEFGKFFQEGVAPDGTGKSGAMSAAEAENRIAQLKKDPDFRGRYLNGESNAVDEMRKLQQIRKQR